MKKVKNKGGGNDYVEVEGSRERGEPQKPGENKILEKKWKEFVRENKESKQTPAEKRAGKPKKAGKNKPSEEKESAKETQKPVEESVEKPEKTVNREKEAAPKKSNVKEFLETDVDKLYELAREKGILKVKDAAKILGIDIDQIEEWGRILEEHKLVRLRYPPVGDPVLILKRFTSDTEKIKGLKERKKLKPRKRIFIINLIIIAFFALFISFYAIRFQTIRITYTQAYLAAAVIIIIGIIFVLRFVKKRGKNGKGSGEKGDKQTQKP